ncbi:unnamed protein product [Arctia plantaginis]|uniref:Uncharacterized protein n=1 Tax=Arctia plantaginis TaxID=874455 RepID=A0A8S0Z925_ARCPL|nr:unnamed protein product [Arctia plantaginis]
MQRQRQIESNCDQLTNSTAQVDSNQFLNLFCDHVLKRRDEILTPAGAADTKLDLLKLLAELTEHCGELENPENSSCL